MTHEVDRDGEVVDVWDDLPDATDIAEHYPTADDLATWDAEAQDDG